MSKRYIENPFTKDQVFSKDLKFLNDGLLEFLSEIDHAYDISDPKVLQHVKETDDWGNYHGIGGVALMFFIFHKEYRELDPVKKFLKSKANIVKDLFKSKSGSYFLDKAKDLSDLNNSFFSAYASQKKKVTPSFVDGWSGPWILRALISWELKETKSFSETIAIILQFDDVITDKTRKENEFLYGRAGYLYGLLLLQKYTADSKWAPKITIAIKTTIQMMLEQGTASDRQHLMYAWHTKNYVGAAHGISGILLMLIKAIENEKLELGAEANQKISSTFELMVNLQDPRGNFPSSLGRSVNEYSQFCHGAPGVLFSLCNGAKFYRHLKSRGEDTTQQQDQKTTISNNNNTHDDKNKNKSENDTSILQQQSNSPDSKQYSSSNSLEQKLLTAAEKSGSYIWKHGLLTKGPGLCHGHSGNGFALLYLSHSLKQVDPESAMASQFLENALAFAFFTLGTKEGRATLTMPDQPLCYYNGKAGACVYYAELLKYLQHPHHTPTFHGFDL